MSEKIKVNFDKSTSKSNDNISEYFIKDDGSEYLVRNLNATIQHLERTCSTELGELVASKGKVTVKQVNQIVEALVKAKLQDVEVQ